MELPFSFLARPFSQFVFGGFLLRLFFGLRRTLAASSDPLIDGGLVKAPEPTDTNGRDLAGGGMFADRNLMKLEILGQLRGRHNLSHSHILFKKIFCPNGSKTLLAR